MSGTATKGTQTAVTQHHDQQYHFGRNSMVVMIPVFAKLVKFFFVETDNQRQHGLPQKITLQQSIYINKQRVQAII